MIVSVHYLFTRDQRPFASATLEDLDGSIEVMVWPKVFVDTRDLWQEGNIILVEGKVRLRDDRVQLNCDHARLYQPEAAQVTEPSPAAQPDEEPAAEDTTTATPTIESRQLVISLTQTSDTERDIAYLNKLINILKDFPGQDEVSLRVTNKDKIFNLKLPNTTNYCPELHQRLVELVGEDGLVVEPLTS